MIRLTFYGGVGEIGGNKILLEDEERRLLLDFGFPYKGYKRFYQEYMKQRGGAGLLDPLTMGLLPPLEGIYRPDLEVPGLWERFRQHPLYRKIDSIDGVLLTHAHLDHSAHISFLDSPIPVYATATTTFITKAIQDSGKSDFDQQVCYYGPVTRGAPKGRMQECLLSDKKAPKQQRQFRIADCPPESLSPEAAQFWSSGFWEKTVRQKGMASCALTGHGQCGFTLRCFPVDHSIPGACAWAIETSAGWVVYSGDLRFHGKRAGLTEAFLKEAAKLKPRALILEGTRVNVNKNVSEKDVSENAHRAVGGAKGLAIADFSARDIDRLLTFWQVAREAGRKLVILPRDAFMLKVMRLMDSRIPDLAAEDSILIYQETSASNSIWQEHLFQEYAGKIVLAKDVASAPEQFLLCFSFFDLNELPSIQPKSGGRYVYSSSEPHDEEQEIDFRRLHNWLERFQIEGFGLPVESGDKWVIPDEQGGLHASGHACGPDLLRTVREIRPETLIPVHTEHAGVYVERLTGSDTEVSLPRVGGVIELN